MPGAAAAASAAEPAGIYLMVNAFSRILLLDYSTVVVAVVVVSAAAAGMASEATVE